MGAGVQLQFSLSIVSVEDETPEWLQGDSREWTNGASTVARAEHRSRAARSSALPERRVGPILK